MATAQAAKVEEIPPSPHSSTAPDSPVFGSTHLRSPGWLPQARAHMLSPATDSRTYPESKEEVPSTPVPTPELSWFAVHAPQARPRGLLNNLAP